MFIHEFEYISENFGKASAVIHVDDEFWNVTVNNQYLGVMEKDDWQAVTFKTDSELLQPEIKALEKWYNTSDEEYDKLIKKQ